MGWAAYSMRRVSATGEDIGYITVRFPKVMNVIDIPVNTRLSQLLENPDYPIEANVFAVEESIPGLENAGITTAINLTLYQDEKWYLSNGWHFAISKLNPAYDHPYIYVTIYNPDETGVYGGWSAEHIGGLDSYERVFYPNCLVADNQESACTPFTVYSGYSHNGALSFNNNKLPSYNIHDLQFFKDATPIVESADPYNPGGESETGGGTGTFEDISDDIDIPALPTLSATNAGFITLFNPTLAQLQELSSYMWSDLFNIDGWKKIFADPMNAILGLSIVPVDVPSSSARPLAIGNISTGISINVADAQFLKVDCGTLEVREFWGAYLDYAPYTKAEIYLPYIGIRPLSVDDIMNKSVHVVYHIDILSGACCAYVKCGGSVLYSFIGQCAASIPITGDSWANVLNGAISIAGAVGTMVATGGMSAPMSIGQIASTSVNAIKPSVEKSGAMAGTGGLMACQTPYIILTRPRQAAPRDQSKYLGYPSFINEALGDLSGYTEVESVHLENVPATESELSEIETLLKGGVIF